MRINSVHLSLLALAIFFASCEKKFFKPPVVDPNIPISFTKDLQPLFTANCTLSGCHNGNVKPDLTPERSYNSLIDGGYTDTLNPSTSLIMIKLNTNMPPSKLPAAEINKVLSWIKQGTKLN
jgi:hypothetical protein